MSKSTFISKIIHISLSSLGILQNQQSAITYAVFVSAAISFCIFGTAVGFFTGTEVVTKLETLVTFAPQVTTFINYLNIFSSRKKLLALLQKIKGNEERANVIINRTNVIVKRRLINFLLLLVLLSAGISLPNLILSFCHTTITDKNSFAVPFWFSCGDGKSNGIWRFVCWNVNSKRELLLANTIASVILGIMFVINCSTFSLYSVIVNELRTHVEQLKIEMTAFTNNYDKVVSDVSKKRGCIRDHVAQVDKKDNQNFQKVIKYQQFIRRYVVFVENKQFFATQC